MNKFKTIIASCLIALSVGSISTAIVQSVNATEVKAAIPSGLYDDCEAATTVSDLWTAVKVAANKNYNQGTTYDGLWTWYWTTDVRSDGKMNDYYSSSTNYTSSGQCGTYNVEGDCYNREHTIPKSWWNSPSPGAKGYPQTDIIIVIPTDGYVNNRRNNFPLGETNGETYKSNNSFSKLGSSTLSDYTNVGTVFEVNDKYKGDFARIHFYALAKWNNYNFGQDSTYSTKMFRNTTEKTESNKFGFTDYSVALLTKWHTQDPVDDWEKQRNEKVYGLQGNRNPFVDHPEYADYLWGGKSIPSGGDSSSSSESSSSSSSSSSTTSSGSGTVPSGDYTFTAGVDVGTYNGSNSSNQGPDSVTKSGVTMSTTKGAFAASNQYRVYSGQTLTFSCDSTITQIAFTGTSSNNLGNLSTSIGTYTYNSSNYSATWTGSANSVEFTTSAQVRFSPAVVTVYNESGTVVAVTGLNISKSSASLTAGGDTTISATITPNDATNKTVNWKSSNTSVATVSSATSQSGALITIHAVAAGDATITASSDYDSSISKTCTVSVTAATPTVTSVTLNKSTLSLSAGSSETLTATVNGTGSPAQTVTWTSSNENVATVTSSGVVTVKSNATVGQTATITATSTVDKTKKGDCTLTVKSSGSETQTISDNLTRETTGVTSGSTTYSSWSGKQVASNAIYAGMSAGGNDSIQLRSSSSNSGVVTTASGGTFKKITVSWNSETASGRTLNVYGKTNAYSAATDLYSSNNQGTLIGTIIKGTSTELTSDGSYAYIGFRSNSGAMYIDEVQIDWEVSGGTPSKTLTSISLSGYKETFTVGDEFSYGGTVIANYSDGTDADVTASASFSGYDMSSTGNQTVTVSYGGQSETYNITVNAITPTENNTYKLVSDASKLRAGDKVIIVNTDGDYALSTTQNTNNRKATSVTKNNDNTISITGAVQSLELKDGTASGTFSFYTGNGYLFAAGSGSGSNYLRTEETLSDNSSFEITIENSVATVIAQGTYTNNTMRYNANNGNPIFSCYASSTNSVSIYKKLYTAVEYSKIFLEEVGCDASGATAPSQTKWSLVKDIYTNELSSDAKTTLSDDSIAHEYKNPSTDEQYLAQAMYQYDYIMVKYNKTSVVYEKFITGRTSNGLIFNGNIYASNMNDNIVPILVIIGILSLTGAGMILFVRKRKEI